MNKHWPIYIRTKLIMKLTGFFIIFIQILILTCKFIWKLLSFSQLCFNEMTFIFKSNLLHLFFPLLFLQHFYWILILSFFEQLKIEKKKLRTKNRKQFLYKKVNLNLKMVYNPVIVSLATWLIIQWKINQNWYDAFLILTPINTKYFVIKVTRKWR